jgi:D-glycero-alpha-D-manno-heptose 1-phosphate guanylyltransferase
MEAIILAGGFGTRLRSVVADRPKALAEIAGKPFLHFLVEYYQSIGVTKFLFSVGYLHAQVTEFLKEYFPQLSYQVVVEDEPLGTGGAIRLCLESATSSDVLIINGDTFHELDLEQYLNFHLTNSAACSIAIKPMTNFDRYGSVVIDEFSRIIKFNEKQHCASGLINTGVILANLHVIRKMLQNLPNSFSFEREFLQTQLSSIPIFGFLSQGYFIDIGIPEDFLKAQNDFKAISKT